MAVLLFDVMGTLVVDPFYEAMPAFFEMRLDELLELKHPTAWVEFEHGRIAEPTFLERFFADGRPYDQRGFVDWVRAHYAWIEGMEPLLAALCAAGHELHALSNYPSWYRMIEERLAPSRYLSWTFVSCETGVRKPDPKAYRHAADSLDVRPEACIFVDDRRTNVDAACAVGMDGILFESAAQLRDALVARHILAP